MLFTLNPLISGGHRPLEACKQRLWSRNCFLLFSYRFIIKSFRSYGFSGASFRPLTFGDRGDLNQIGYMLAITGNII
jgi:hypothetical protein